MLSACDPVFCIVMTGRSMSRAVSSASVLCLVLGMFISGVRIAQIAHDEIGAAPVLAQREAERMWTNEFALKALRIEIFKPRRQRFRLKRECRHAHRSETLKIRRRLFQQRSRRRRSEFIVSAALFRRSLQVPLVVQKVYDMLEAQTPLELLQVNALHTFVSLCDAYMLRYLQRAAQHHVQSRSSRRNHYMLCSTLGTCKRRQSMLIEHNAPANTSCISSKCKSAVAAPEAPTSSCVNISDDADAIISEGPSHASVQQARDASAAAFGGEILCDPHPLSAYPNSSSANISVDKDAFIVSTSVDAKATISVGLPHASAQQARENHQHRWSTVDGCVSGLPCFEVRKRGACEVGDVNSKSTEKPPAMSENR